MSDDLHRAAAARDLAQALRSARSHALLQGQPVLVLALDGNWGNGWRVVLEHNQQVLREQRLARPLKIVSNRGEQFKFSALGVPMTSGNGWLGATLEMCERSSARSRYQVALASSGRVRLVTEDLSTGRC
jgi:type IV fimbrial biogenesis protein FimT